MCTATSLLKVFTVVLATAALACTSAAAEEPPAGPVSVSVQCRIDTARRTGCDLVVSFFRSVNTRRYARACSLLGKTLREKTGGERCPAIIAADGPQRYAIRGARIVQSRVGVVVSIWLPEFDHFRELRWLAIIAPERGQLRIIETRPV
jgi:hypothetical protein